MSVGSTSSSVLLLTGYCLYIPSFFFFFNDTATTEIYTLSLHDALPISAVLVLPLPTPAGNGQGQAEPTSFPSRSEEHTSELQSLRHLVCRLLLEKKKIERTSRCAARRISTNISRHIHRYRSRRCTRRW